MLTTASYARAAVFHGHQFARVDRRQVVRGVRVVAERALVVVAAAAAVGVLITTVTLTAAWLVNIGLATNPQLQARGPSGPATLALAGYDQVQTAAFDTKWARATGSMQASAVPLIRERPTLRAEAIPLPPRHPAQVQVKHEVAQATRLVETSMPAASAEISVPLPPRRPIERPASVPLPRPHPPAQLALNSPQTQIAPPVVVAPPVAPVAIEKRAAPEETPKPVAGKPQEPAKPQQAVKPQDPPKAQPVVKTQEAPKTQEAHNRAPALPTADSRTAVYDISAHTVYLPKGERLEAHSGLGERMDDPRFVHVRMRGATPPNTYQLTLREQLFHGVRALRLNPVNEDQMFGRDGILAHTYMLGSSGQSNGCVSFRHYDKFLQAFLRGEVDRMVVVSSLGPGASQMARTRRHEGYHYAANDYY
jgi:Tlde1 domain